MSITAKTAGRVTGIFLLAALLLAVAYQVSYPIELNLAMLPEEIAAFHNRESEDLDPSEITVYDGVGIGNREYYLIEMGEHLGSVALKRSLTGRYKIEYLTYGDGGLRDSIVESEGKKYLLLGGRDPEVRLARITVSIGGLTYDLEKNWPRDHFLLCAEIDSRVKDNHVDRDKVRFYSAEGEDITGLYDLSGGGI